MDHFRPDMSDTRIRSQMPAFWPQVLLGVSAVGLLDLLCFALIQLGTSDNRVWAAIFIAVGIAILIGIFTAMVYRLHIAIAVVLFGVFISYLLAARVFSF
jgi:hypothetical protein